MNARDDAVTVFGDSGKANLARLLGDPAHQKRLLTSVIIENGAVQGKRVVLWDPSKPGDLVEAHPALGVRPAIPADLGGGKTPLCAHERPLASCRDEYTLQQQADFDAAHKAAYDYALWVARERDDAERFAAAVAEVAARSGLEYVDLRRDLGQWIREGRVT